MKSDELFDSLRRGPWNDDPNRVAQEGRAGTGNVDAFGWLADGSVYADAIQANAVTAGKIEAGAVTTAKLAAGSVTANEIASNAVTAVKINASAVTTDKLDALSITSGKIQADAVTVTKILAGNVTSGKIELVIDGKNFSALDSDTNGSNPGVYFDVDNTTGLTLFNGDLFLVADLDVSGGVPTIRSGFRLKSTSNNIQFWGTDFYPVLGDFSDLGRNGDRWATVWCVNLDQSSDERLKRDIEDDPLGLDFILKLRPRVFRWRETKDQVKQEPDEDAFNRESAPWREKIRAARRDRPKNEQQIVMAAREKLREITEKHQAPRPEAREGRRLHHGLIAQEVKAALDAAGVDSMDAAFWSKNQETGEESLSYTGLIAPMLRAIQELADRVERLEEERS
jgi:hypothetical protein